MHCSESRTLLDLPRDALFKALSRGPRSSTSFTSCDTLMQRSGIYVDTPQRAASMRRCQAVSEFRMRGIGASCGQANCDAGVRFSLRVGFDMHNWHSGELADATIEQDTILVFDDFFF